jgi:hypothetical protein
LLIVGGKILPNFWNQKIEKKNEKNLTWDVGLVIINVEFIITGKFEKVLW